MGKQLAGARRGSGVSARPENDCPPAVGAAEGRSIAVGANAGAAYRGNGAAGNDEGKRSDAEIVPSGFTGPPVWELARRDGLLRAGEREFKGARFFELRLWASEGATPTGKGVTMPCEAVGSLARALTAYAAALAANAPQSGS